MKVQALSNTLFLREELESTIKELTTSNTKITLDKNKLEEKYKLLND